MSKPSVGTIIGIALVSYVYCNSLHHPIGESGKYYAISGVFKLSVNPDLKIKYCGQELTNKYNAVCKGTPKRSGISLSEISEDYEGMSKPHFTGEFSAEGPLNTINRAHLLSILKRDSVTFERHLRNAVSECCEGEGCTEADIKKFCGNRPGAKVRDDPVMVAVVGETNTNNNNNER